LVAARRAIGGRAIAGAMSFDSLAAHYRWMEWLLAGRKLQRCRTAFLGRIHPPREVLLLGEGNGRFLEALLLAYPQARVTCVDASAAMLERARARLAARDGEFSNVSFVHADIFSWIVPRKKFDLIASHFFLDCFLPDEVDWIVDRIAAAAAPNAQWLLADFREPAAGPARWRARLILRSMYAFFRRVTGLSGSRITPPGKFLQPRGFRLREQVITEWGLLHSDWWSRDCRGAGLHSRA
jgi:ubiquinone/menaquinone biosynthesis C-methylase UbiE